MKAVAAVAVMLVGASGFCNVTDLRQGSNHGGQDHAHFASKSVTDCQQRCCEDSSCEAFTWTSYQPFDSGVCGQGTACCWLKSGGRGRFVEKDNCTSGEVRQLPLMSPRFTKVVNVAEDSTGNLRDPSAMIQDPRTGKWHFWVVYIPGSRAAGWRGFLHHYSADAIEGPFTNNGLAMNHSSDPDAFDAGGMFSPSALYDEVAGLWYLFYSGTGANMTQNPIAAQLVASAPSPDGPWTRLGLVTYPTGSEDLGYNVTWNGRRLDSGRALMLNGRRGYWTKGCRNSRAGHTCSEGAYFPDDASSWSPPYSESGRNPIFEADGSAGYRDAKGYENCEFFLGPEEEAVEGQRLTHVLCTGHSGRHPRRPHFVADRSGLSWTFVESLPASSANEATPVYHGGLPGDVAEVTHFLGRQEGANSTCASNHICIGLYKLEWVPQGADIGSIVV